MLANVPTAPEIAQVETSSIASFSLFLFLLNSSQNEASFYEEFKRNRKRLKDAIDEVSTCAISGAVGTFANINPNVEKHVAKKLGLKVEPISTQVIPRDRHAFYFSVLGIIAGSIERLASLSIDPAIIPKTEK